MLFAFSCVVLCCGKLGTLPCHYLTVKPHRKLYIWRWKGGNGGGGVVYLEMC